MDDGDDDNKCHNKYLPLGKGLGHHTPQWLHDDKIRDYHRNKDDDDGLDTNTDWDDGDDDDDDGNVIVGLSS